MNHRSKRLTSFLLLFVFPSSQFSSAPALGFGGMARAAANNCDYTRLYQSKLEEMGARLFGKAIAGAMGKLAEEGKANSQNPEFNQLVQYYGDLLRDRNIPDSVPPLSPAEKEELIAKRKHTFDLQTPIVEATTPEDRYSIGMVSENEDRSRKSLRQVEDAFEGLRWHVKVCARGGCLELNEKNSTGVLQERGVVAVPGGGWVDPEFGEIATASEAKKVNTRVAERLGATADDQTREYWLKQLDELSRLAGALDGKHREGLGRRHRLFKNYINNSEDFSPEEAEDIFETIAEDMSELSGDEDRKSYSLIQIALEKEKRKEQKREREAKRGEEKKSTPTPSATDLWRKELEEAIADPRREQVGLATDATAGMLSVLPGQAGVAHGIRFMGQRMRDQKISELARKGVELGIPLEEVNRSAIEAEIQGIVASLEPVYQQWAASVEALPKDAGWEEREERDERFSLSIEKKRKELERLKNGYLSRTLLTSEAAEEVWSKAQNFVSGAVQGRYDLGDAFQHLGEIQVYDDSGGNLKPEFETFLEKANYARTRALELKGKTLHYAESSVIKDLVSAREKLGDEQFEKAFDLYLGFYLKKRMVALSAQHGANRASGREGEGMEEMEEVLTAFKGLAAQRSFKFADIREEMRDAKVSGYTQTIEGMQDASEAAERRAEAAKRGMQIVHNPDGTTEEVPIERHFGDQLLETAVGGGIHVVRFGESLVNTGAAVVLDPDSAFIKKNTQWVDETFGAGVSGYHNLGDQSALSLFAKPLTEGAQAVGSALEVVSQTIETVNDATLATGYGLSEEAYFRRLERDPFMSAHKEINEILAAVAMLGLSSGGSVANMVKTTSVAAGFGIVDGGAQTLLSDDPSFKDWGKNSYESWKKMTFDVGFLKILMPAAALHRYFILQGVAAIPEPLEVLAGEFANYLNGKKVDANKVASAVLSLGATAIIMRGSRPGKVRPARSKAGSASEAKSNREAKLEKALKKDYDTLGVKRGATFEEVNRAYRLKALKVDPNKFFGNPRMFVEMNEKLRELIEAYKNIEAHLKGATPAASSSRTSQSSSASQSPAPARASSQPAEAAPKRPLLLTEGPQAQPEVAQSRSSETSSPVRGDATGITASSSARGDARRLQQGDLGMTEAFSAPAKEPTSSPAPEGRVGDLPDPSAETARKFAAMEERLRAEAQAIQEESTAKRGITQPTPVPPLSPRARIAGSIMASEGDESWRLDEERRRKEQADRKLDKFLFDQIDEKFDSLVKSNPSQRSELEARREAEKERLAWGIAESERREAIQHTWNGILRGNIGALQSLIKGEVQPEIKTAAEERTWSQPEVEELKSQKDVLERESQRQGKRFDDSYFQRLMGIIEARARLEEAGKQAQKGMQQFDEGAASAGKGEVWEAAKREAADKIREAKEKYGDSGLVGMARGEDPGEQKQSLVGRFFGWLKKGFQEIEDSYYSTPPKIDDVVSDNFRHWAREKPRDDRYFKHLEENRRHPTAGTLAALAEGNVSPDQSPALMEHLVSCPSCRSIFKAVLREPGEVTQSRSSETSSPERPGESDVDVVDDQAGHDRKGGNWKKTGFGRPDPRSGEWLNPGALIVDGTKAIRAGVRKLWDALFGRRMSKGEKGEAGAKSEPATKAPQSNTADATTPQVPTAAERSSNEGGSQRNTDASPQWVRRLTGGDVVDSVRDNEVIGVLRITTTGEYYLWYGSRAAVAQAAGVQVDKGHTGHHRYLMDVMAYSPNIQKQGDWKGSFGLTFDYAFTRFSSIPGLPNPRIFLSNTSTGEVPKPSDIPTIFNALSESGLPEEGDIVVIQWKEEKGLGGFNRYVFRNGKLEPEVLTFEFNGQRWSGVIDMRGTDDKWISVVVNGTTMQIPREYFRIVPEENRSAKGDFVIDGRSYTAGDLAHWLIEAIEKGQTEEYQTYKSYFERLSPENREKVLGEIDKHLDVLGRNRGLLDKEGHPFDTRFDNMTRFSNELRALHQEALQSSAENPASSQNVPGESASGSAATYRSVENMELNGVTLQRGDAAIVDQGKGNSQQITIEELFEMTLPNGERAKVVHFRGQDGVAYESFLFGRDGTQIGWVYQQEAQSAVQSLFENEPAETTFYRPPQESQHIQPASVNVEQGQEYLFTLQSRERFLGVVVDVAQNSLLLRGRDGRARSVSLRQVVAAEKPVYFDGNDLSGPEEGGGGGDRRPNNPPPGGSSALGTGESDAVNGPEGGNGKNRERGGSAREDGFSHRPDSRRGEWINLGALIVDGTKAIGAGVRKLWNALPGRRMSKAEKGEAIELVTQTDQARVLRDYLLSVLPPEGRGVEQRETIGDYVIIYQNASEYLLILKNAELDPVLVTWLEEIKKKFGDVKDEDLLTIATAIAKYVAGTFKTDGENLFHPFRNRKFKELSKRDLYTRLGDFIEAGAGVCRHRAAALQLALQEVGIKSRIVYGHFTEKFAKDGEVNVSAPHVWVEITLDGNGYLFDPMMGNYGLRSGLEGTRFFHKKMRFLGDTILMYEPIEGSVILGGQEPLSGESLDKNLKWLIPALQAMQK